MRHWVSSRCEILGWSLLAYGGDGDPKEHGGERHKAVDPSFRRKPLPLNVADSEEETNKDTYTTNYALTHRNQEKDQALTVHHASQERPKEARKIITYDRHSE